MKEQIDLLDEQEMERYARQIIVPDIGVEGQLKLFKSSILIIGLGGLGSPAALYLAAAGVGTLGIVDFDRVTLSNLQRQILYRSKHLNAAKTEIAAEQIEELNPAVNVVNPAKIFNESNACETVRDYDFILDCTDNFETKKLIAQSCFAERKAYCHAGIVQFEGQALTVLPGKTACLQCLLDTEILHSATCGELGVFGAAAGILGCIQATEAVKYIISRGKLLSNRLLLMNALDMNIRVVPVRPSQTCLVCGAGKI